MTKTLDTLVEDIYQLFDDSLNHEEGLKIPEEDLDHLVNSIKDTILHWAEPRASKKHTLRMSNVGYPNRKLWFDAQAEDNSDSSLKPSDAMKFLFGHVVEELVLFFARLAGHKVENEQKEVDVDGVLGHMDCTIDGQVVDVKTASPYSFQKFVNGRVAEEDPFGYMAQLAGYEHAMGTEGGGFLVVNKVTGELTLFRPDFSDLPNIQDRIAQLRKELGLKKPPPFCYPPVVQDNGNTKIAKDCLFCKHKVPCYADEGVRVFRYASGDEFLIGEVVKLPRVEEVTHEYHTP
jgi:hypothetical protein